MGIFKKIGKILSPPPTSREQGLYLYVQCSKCGEKLHTRIDLQHDLTPEYSNSSDLTVSYFCRKELIGEKLCYQPIELQLKFDLNRRLTDQSISGGKFIDQAEFEAEG